MGDFKFVFEWEDPQDAQGAELRATWARLSICVGDKPVTRLLDLETAKSVRDSIYVPLYPLAEWIALHWWHLFYEVDSSVSPRQATYRQRHSPLFGRDGYAMPDLRIRPVGQFSELQWEQFSLPECRLEFISTGKALIASDDLRQEFQRLIEVVIKRLDDSKVSGTQLQDEWNCILQMHPEEAAFCKAAAALGLDAFALNAAKRKSILETYQKIPTSLYNDFLAVADPERIREQAEQLQAAVHQIEHLAIDLTGLKKIRAKSRNVSLPGMPWEQGYKFARNLRSDLRIKDNAIKDIDQFGRAFNLKSGQFSEALLDPGKNGFFDAVVGCNQNQSPGFVIPKKRKESRHFTLCRALFEYLTTSSNAPSMIAELHTERQQRNRAFAAEFLAPAQLIEKRLTGRIISDEQVQDIAEAFGVSPFVIAHQIENHRLGKIHSLSDRAPAAVV